MMAMYRVSVYVRVSVKEGKGAGLNCQIYIELGDDIMLKLLYACAGYMCDPLPKDTITDTCIALASDIVAVVAPTTHSFVSLSDDTPHSQHWIIIIKTSTHAEKINDRNTQRRWPHILKHLCA